MVEQSMNIKFCVRLGKVLRRLCKAAIHYRERKLLRGRESVEDDKRSGRTAKNTEKVSVAVLASNNSRIS
ncbi:hypothetical protein TNCV_2281361 [Trichonephila clavipes]|nr:hypothetical protein TNCV_2281361 [Trichonephila clavipes]